MTRQMAFVSTCSASGWDEYGETFISSFINHFPAQTRLYFYVDFKVRIDDPRITVRNLADCRGLDAFQQSVASLPFATGGAVVHDRHQAAHTPSITWNARKFSFKVFSVEDAVRRADDDVVTWLDADCVAFRSFPKALIEELIPPWCMLSYLGRSWVYSECGYVSYNRQHPLTERFVTTVADLYRDGVVFGMKEWHDSYIFDVVRTEFEHRFGVENFNISHDQRYANHVFINSPIGLHVDHLKGGRKELGRSSAKDLQTTHKIDYWSEQD